MFTLHKIISKEIGRINNQLIIKADSGDPESMYQLGCLYLNIQNGRCVDGKKGVEYLKKALEKDHLEAKCILGVCYINGTGELIKNYSIAYQLFMNASTRGSSTAKYCLGVCFYMGYGVEKNDMFALSFFNNSAICNNNFGKHAMGLIYANGLMGIPKNDAIAFKIFHDLDDKFQVGLFHLLGRGGLPVNQKIGIGNIKIAAINGNILAENFIGNSYLLGYHGLKIDIHKGIYFLNEACKKGSEEALLKMAQINDEGLFGQYINIDQAKKFYQLAAEIGNEYARIRLTRYIIEDEKDVANILTNLKHCVRA